MQGYSSEVMSRLSIDHEYVFTLTSYDGHKYYCTPQSNMAMNFAAETKYILCIYIAQYNHNNNIYNYTMCVTNDYAVVNTL